MSFQSQSVRIKLVDLLPHKKLIEEKFSRLVPIAVNYVMEIRKSPPPSQNIITIVERYNSPYTSYTLLTDHLKIVNISEFDKIWLDPNIFEKINNLIKNGK